jgi:hypothetical protein
MLFFFNIWHSVTETVNYFYKLRFSVYRSESEADICRAGEHLGIWVEVSPIAPNSCRGIESFCVAFLLWVLNA